LGCPHEQTEVVLAYLCGVDEEKEKEPNTATFGYDLNILDDAAQVSLDVPGPAPGTGRGQSQHGDLSPVAEPPGAQVLDTGRGQSQHGDLSPVVEPPGVLAESHDLPGASRDDAVQSHECHGASLDDAAQSHESQDHDVGKSALKMLRIPMSIFLELLMVINAGRPPAPYRIVFVARGHPVTRCRRRLRDATRHTVLPGAGKEVKLTAVLDIVTNCCGSARRCKRAECETRMQNTFCCGPQDFSPFLEALVTKQYIQLSGDDICLTPDRISRTVPGGSGRTGGQWFTGV